MRASLWLSFGAEHCHGLERAKMASTAEGVEHTILKFPYDHADGGRIHAGAADLAIHASERVGS